MAVANCLWQQIKREKKTHKEAERKRMKANGNRNYISKYQIKSKSIDKNNNDNNNKKKQEQHTAYKYYYTI